MKNVKIVGKFSAKFFAAAVFFVAVFFALFGSFFTSSQNVTASAASGDLFAIEKYDAEVTVNEDRTVDFHESMTVRFSNRLPSGMSTYYRSLPIGEGDRYFDVSAKCEGNDDFSFSVADNPDVDGFIDVNCKGGVVSGKTWTYEFFYTLLPKAKSGENGMILDVVGFGTGVAINDANITVRFPDECSFAKVYSSANGGKGNDYVTETLAADKKSIFLHADKLPVKYNSKFGENMAVGITLEFELENGALKSYASTRVTGSVWAVVISGLLAVGAAIGLSALFRKKQDIVRVVNLKPPKGMDPLKMGKLIDGAVDDEDITSMIYWFASKGYLKIDLSDEDDPVLERTEKELDENAPSYQRVLLEGLFDDDERTAVSDLKNKFYASADKAKNLVTAKAMPRYEKKSLFAAAACGLIAAAYCVFCPLLIGLRQIGGGYTFWGGGVFTLAPVFAVLAFLFLRHGRQFKGGVKNRFGWLIAAFLVALISSFAYIFLLDVHVISVCEQVILCVGVWAVVFVGSRIPSYNNGYVRVLGDILGFKDFIEYTEEDKIKFMLQENPELYYDVLPYAQVLGVTDEWEGKFKNVLLEPPAWASGDFTVFDYLLLRNCMRTVAYSVMSRPQEQRGGSVVGRSGGGGGFGGFSGGGSGGGGFGVR